MDKIIFILLLIIFSCKNEKKENLTVVNLNKENIYNFNKNQFNIIYSKYGEEFNLNKNTLSLGSKIVKKDLLTNAELNNLKMLFYQSNLNNLEYSVNGKKYIDEGYVLTSFSTDNITIMKDSIDWCVLRFQKGITYKENMVSDDSSKISFYLKIDSILSSKVIYRTIIENKKRTSFGL